MSYLLQASKWLSSELSQRTLNNTQHDRSMQYASYNSMCPFYKRETEGGRSFAVSTRLWNNVPLNIRKSDSVSP